MAAPTNTWTATANAAWLHLSASGAGSMNVVFSYDANPGGTRSGTLTIAGLPLTVTQAGSTYVPAPGPVTTLVAAGLIGPTGVGVDGVGNVYFADTYNNAIKEWTAASNTVTTLASGLNQPTGVAVDGAGNVYFANDYGFIDEWMVANNTVSQVTALGLFPDPLGVAVDGAGNLYFGVEWGTGLMSDFYGLGEWTAASQKNTIPLPGTYLEEAPENLPGGVAVDAAGNVYFTAAGALNEWNGWNATNTAYLAQFSSLFTPLVGGLNNPWGVAVDGGGNVYIADTGHQAIKEWTAANNSVTTLVSSGLGSPKGIAVDAAGNVYFADWGQGAIKELPHAFVDPTAKSEGPAAGSDGLPVVLPATANLLAPFAPTSDQPWLTITGITNGVVSFAFSANTGSTNRTANITLLGQSIAITQTALPVAITQQPVNLMVCAGCSAAFTVAAAGMNLDYQWQVSQDNGITFTNISASATNASYTNLAPAAADNGKQYQVVVSGGGASVTSAPPAVLTVNPPATASACANQTICAGSATAALGGTVGGGATGGTWSSSGTGSFAPNATTLNATYTPSAADITAGTVTLTLGTTGQLSPCTPATAQVVLTIIPVTVTPPILIGPTLLSNGLFQFAFSNTDPCASFTVLTTTNPWLPLSNWTVAGPATNSAPGLFQFGTGTTNTPQGFYRVRSP